MDRIMRRIHALGGYQRLAYIITTTLFLCCCPSVNANSSLQPQELAVQVLDQVDAQNSNALIEQFDVLDEAFSENALAQGRKFLEAFIVEVNSKYGLNLTTTDACKLVRENLHTLNLSEDLQKVVLSTIKLYEPDLQPTEVPKEVSRLASNVGNVAMSLYWPWQWNWFGMNKKHKSNNSHFCLSRHAYNTTGSTLMDEELPGNCYLGGCELLAGALVFILPIPGAAWLGGVMMGDGIRRVADGIVQLSDERRANPNYTPPPPPPGFNF
jgi:hypothetical protein